MAQKLCGNDSRSRRGMQKLSGKRNRFGQHSGEQYDCTEEVLRRRSQDGLIIFQVKGQRQIEGLLIKEKILDLLFCCQEIIRFRAETKKQEY